jgi:blue copper oxidase
MTQGRQVYMGLTGMITVDDGTDGRLGLPRTYGVDDLPIRSPHLL